MGNDKNQRLIDLLKILAKGCKKHPAYRAIRKATERCEEFFLFGKQELSLINSNSPEEPL